jgi:hypothetical protein
MQQFDAMSEKMLPLPVERVASYVDRITCSRKRPLWEARSLHELVTTNQGRDCFLGDLLVTVIAN